MEYLKSEHFIQVLTLLTTIFIAVIVYRYQERKDKEGKGQYDIKSYLELYQYFIGVEFREKRQIGWNVVRRCIENPEYSEFVIQEQYVSRYSNRMPRKKVFEKFKHIYNEDYKTQKEFLHKESEDRHKLDSVVNFFNLLAIIDLPKASYNVSDFYYDSWRPILCWYAKKLEEGYSKSEDNKQFNNSPNLRKTIEKLDEKFYCPDIPDNLTIEDIEEHPIIKCYMEKTMHES